MLNWFWLSKTNSDLLTPLHQRLTHCHAQKRPEHPYRNNLFSILTCRPKSTIDDVFTKGLTNYRVKLLKSKLIVHDRSHACGGVLAIIKITPRINELLLEKKKKKRWGSRNYIMILAMIKELLMIGRIMQILILH